ncbi:discoidin domain-containing protein [Winogradskyella sp. PAMC22761]|nr:discoidin domain-containing protein [Winogradskyella sp. PAMC22761]
MIKIFTPLLCLLLAFSTNMFAQQIDQSNYSIQSYSTDNNSTPVANAFDGNTSTYWAIYNAGGFSLPAYVEVDLGATHDVNGFSYTPNANNLERKAVGYEIYLSTDGSTWGTPESVGDFVWADLSDAAQKDITFGAVSARYVKVVYTSNNSDTTDNTHTAELIFYESSTGSTQENQTIAFNPVENKSSTAAPFAISASASSGLTDITYSVESGPATIIGNTVTLTGVAGIVTLKAEQAGDSNYYAAEAYQQFEVLDLSTYYPTVSTRLTEDYSLEMPSFYAYPIYVTSSIEEPDFMTIDYVEISVDGNPITIVGEEGLHYGLWTPTSYGTKTVNITVFGTNGNSTTITRNINVTDVINTQNVQTMEDVVIEIGTENSQFYYGTHTLPQHIGSYDEIIANLTVECPSDDGDCDDWDRRANIDVMGPDGNWIQIIRYITPYGVGCNHTIDLTDYASLLQGEVEFRMYIQTYGTGGWQISLDFDFIQGTPTYLYSNIDELWDGSWDFGDPSNLQPVDVINYTYDSNILSSHLRLSTTGHGWGDNNTSNAAEFYNATHYIDVDGVPNYTQNLWNTCNPNPDNCTGQLGTWTYSRAGWCPGAISPPDIIDMTAQIANSTVDFSYRFDPTYVDYCHPNSEDCISGTTCTDCDDGFKAQYVIDGQLINFSNTPLIQGTLGIEEINNTSTYELLAYPNPSTGVFQISSPSTIGKSVMHIQSVSGEIIKSYYLNSAAELNNKTFDLSSVASGVYFISIENNAGQGNLKLIIQ